MSKAIHKKILAKQSRITKKSKQFISKHKILANVGMVLFALLLFLAVSGMSAKIINSSYVSKLLGKNNSISSNVDVSKGTSNIKVCMANDTKCLGNDNSTHASAPDPVASPAPAPVKTSQQNNNSSNYIPPICTKTAIPYSTSYQNASYMNVGQTFSSGGTNGWKETCTADSDGFKPTDITIPPVNQIIYVGTRQPATLPPPTTTPPPNYVARDKCVSDYNSAMAQISNAGAGDSSAVAVVQNAYSQCLRNAGF
jgi:hypothetical protein